jgi:hypothetical protein
MPDLNIRNVDRELLTAVNVAAAKAELTQRDWVIRTLSEASNGKVELPVESEPTDGG